MYIFQMYSVSVADARSRLSEMIDRTPSEAVVVERRGVPAAVLVSPEFFERAMAALEDLDDANAIDEAMAEEGPNIPWEQVKADLGWE